MLVFDLIFYIFARFQSNLIVEGGDIEAGIFCIEVGEEG